MKKYLLNITYSLVLLSIASCSTNKNSAIQSKTEVVTVKSKDELPDKAADSVSDKELKEAVMTSPTWEGCPTGNQVCFQQNIMKYISKQFKYPQEAKDKGMQGKPFIVFEFDEQGVLDKSSVKVIRSSGYDILDQAAKNIILSIPKLEAPALENGKPTRSKYTLPIRYTLR